MVYFVDLQDLPEGGPSGLLSPVCIVDKFEADYEVRDEQTLLDGQPSGHVPRSFGVSRPSRLGASIMGLEQHWRYLGILVPLAGQPSHHSFCCARPPFCCDTNSMRC